MRRILCFFKVHSWSAFAHIPSRCVDERFCKECQTTESSQVHRWGKWEFITQETNSWVEGELKCVGKRTVQRQNCLDCNFQQYAEAHA